MTTAEWQSAFCLGALAINGDFLLHCTASVNLARHRAASRGLGVVSLGVCVATVISSLTLTCPTRGGVSCGSSFTSD